MIKRTFTRLHSILLIHHQNWHGKSLMVLTCWNNLIDMKLAQITRVVVMSLMRLSKICELCIILAIIWSRKISSPVIWKIETLKEKWFTKIWYIAPQSLKISFFKINKNPSQIYLIKCLGFFKPEFQLYVQRMTDRKTIIWGSRRNCNKYRYLYI